MSEKFTHTLFRDVQGVFIPDMLFDCATIEKAIFRGEMEYNPVIQSLRVLADYLGISMSDIYYNENTKTAKKYIYIKGYVYEDLTHYIGMLEQSNGVPDEFLERIKMRVPILDKQNRELNNWLKEKDYDMFFSFLENQMVLIAMQQVLPTIKSSKVADAFMRGYIMYEGDTNLISDDLISLLTKYPQSKNRRKRLSKLPNGKITLYRGVYSPDNIYGISWTRSLNVATYFANRLGGSGAVFKIELQKQDIIDYYGNIRNEDEVIISRETARRHKPVRIN